MTSPLAISVSVRGDKVLDLGCGLGETCLEIGRRATPSGEVLRVDCTAAFLEVANRERGDAGLAPVRCERGDAQVDPVGRSWRPKRGAEMAASMVLECRNR